MKRLGRELEFEDRGWSAQIKAEGRFLNLWKRLQTGLHHEIKNDRGNDGSAKRRGDGLHDELTGTVGIASGVQIHGDWVNDFHFLHDLSPLVKFSHSDGRFSQKG